MRQTLRSNLLRMWLAGIVGFWAFAYVTKLQTVSIVTDSFTMVSMLFVAVVYAPSAIRTLRHADDSQEAQARLYIYVGILLAFGASFCGRFYNLLWLKSSQNPIDAVNDLRAFFQFQIGVAGAFLLSSPGALGRTRGRRALGLISIIVVSLIVAAGVTYAAVDTSVIMDALRPYTTPSR